MSLSFFEIEKQHQPSDLENFYQLIPPKVWILQKIILTYSASENQIADETIHDI